MKNQWPRKTMGCSNFYVSVLSVKLSRNLDGF